VFPLPPNFFPQMVRFHLWFPPCFPSILSPLGKTERGSSRVTSGSLEFQAAVLQPSPSPPNPLRVLDFVARGRFTRRPLSAPRIVVIFVSKAGSRSLVPLSPTQSLQVPHRPPTFFSAIFYFFPHNPVDMIIANTLYARELATPAPSVGAPNQVTGSVVPDDAPSFSSEMVASPPDARMLVPPQRVVFFDT